MSHLSPEEVAHLAALARLNLSADEQAKFANELPKIVDFVEQLQGVKLDGDIEVAKTTPLEAMRVDEVSGERLTLAQLEKLAPAWRDGQVEVPAVFGDDNV